MAIKLWTGQIGLEPRAAALTMFKRLVAESFTMRPVTGGHFREAAKFVDQHTLRLRAGEALHLATASEHAPRCIHSISVPQKLDRCSACLHGCWHDLAPGRPN